MNKEILVADIPAHVTEKDRLSDSFSSDKWRVMPYETAGISGRMLWANAETFPQDVSVELNARGKYRVYLGMINMGGNTTTGIRFSNDDGKTQLRTFSHTGWSSVEWFEEVYFKTVELDGQTLVVSKPKGYPAADNSALAWIRLVPAPVEAIKKEKTLAYHFDLDYYAEDEYKTPAEYLGRVKMLDDGGMGVLLHEKLPIKDFSHVDWEKVTAREKQYLFYSQNQEEVERELIEYARATGVKIYASYRIEAGGFISPFDSVKQIYNDVWCEDNKELRCQTRDGRYVDVCSYAYPSIRKQVIEMLVNGSKNYDGVCVFFHRGTFVAFEKPVREAVMEKYGVDACRLPKSDPRLHNVLCYFITLFMRELREELDKLGGKRKEINAIVYHTVEDSKYFGYDVETWVNEGLVDSVSQGLMTHYEDLTDCLDEEGLVDLEKYEKELGKRFTITRDYSHNTELIVRGAKDFLRICEGKADFYATLAWESAEAWLTLGLVDELKKLGVQKFISWNTNHKAKYLRRFNAEKFYAAGSKEEYESKSFRHLRTLSLDGKDISQYNPNWKG